LHLPVLPVAMTGAAVCFGLRVLAIHFHWSLPIAHVPNERASAVDEAGQERDRSKAARS
jgi:hypothetical protein